jgi:hypothetical protein
LNALPGDVFFQEITPRLDLQSVVRLCSVDRHLRAVTNPIVARRVRSLIATIFESYRLPVDHDEFVDQVRLLAGLKKSTDPAIRPAIDAIPPAKRFILYDRLRARQPPWMFGELFLITPALVGDVFDVLEQSRPVPCQDPSGAADYMWATNPPLVAFFVRRGVVVEPNSNIA